MIETSPAACGLPEPRRIVIAGAGLSAGTPHTDRGEYRFDRLVLATGAEVGALTAGWYAGYRHHVHGNHAAPPSGLHMAGLDCAKSDRRLTRLSWSVGSYDAHRGVYALREDVMTTLAAERALGNGTATEAAVDAVESSPDLEAGAPPSEE